jgi:adenylylsulfate kinase-like enzyme
MTTRRGTVVWFTGLSGSGKSTLAAAVAAHLSKRGFATEVLDGEELRKHLSLGLGFSRRDRHENMRRAACLAGC